MLLSAVKYCALAISILWIHDPEAGGHADARTIMQSFQQLSISEMHLYTDSFTFFWGVMLCEAAWARLLSLELVA